MIKRKNKKGAEIIEIVLGMAIIGILGASIFTGISSTARTYNTNSLNSTTTQLNTGVTAAKTTYTPSATAGQ